jgi:uncharacterized protein
MGKIRWSGRQSILSCPKVQGGLRSNNSQFFLAAMLDLFLIATLGFLGSFGHCLGMCGPLTAAFSLSSQTQTWQRKLRFNLLLNLGRLISYVLVGLAIGTIGSILVAGGQLAGVGSGFRRGLAVFTGLLLIWLGLGQIQPQWLPSLPLLHPLMGKLHDRLSQVMFRLADVSPIGLGLLWGLMPCGFLYAAQIKAAASSDPQQSALTMLAFGLGTVPMMLGVGVLTTWLSRDKRSQLFRLGGWVTLTIGILTLSRSSDMVDYTGHGALLLLVLALVARPLSRLWSGLLQYRRALGVGAFILTIAHIVHTIEHTFQWNFTAWLFLLPTQRWGMMAGALATVMMMPPAFTSFNAMVKALGSQWRRIHLLSIPALICAAFHALFIGSSYLGALTLNQWYWLRIVMLGVLVLLVLGIRSRRCWQLLNQEKWYVSPNK